MYRVRKKQFLISEILKILNNTSTFVFNVHYYVTCSCLNINFALFVIPNLTLVYSARRPFSRYFKRVFSDLSTFDKEEVLNSFFCFKFRLLTTFI